VLHPESRDELISAGVAIVCSFDPRSVTEGDAGREFTFSGISSGPDPYLRSEVLASGPSGLHTKNWSDRGACQGRSLTSVGAW
jgi:hypothetical protein